MLISAIMLYSIYTGSNSGRVNTRGSGAEATSDALPPANDEKDCADCKLYSNINMWKYFCYKQIDAGNLDIIA